MPIPLRERLRRTVGPLVAGLVLDAADFATLGPIGVQIGWVVGGALGWLLAPHLGFSKAPRWRALCAALAAVYCTTPSTALLPRAAVLAGAARFASEPDDERGEPGEGRGV